MGAKAEMFFATFLQNSLLMNVKQLLRTKERAPAQDKKTKACGIFFFFPENVNCVARWLLSSQEGMNRQTQMTKSLQVKLKEKGKEK